MKGGCHESSVPVAFEHLDRAALKLLEGERKAARVGVQPSALVSAMIAGDNVKELREIQVVVNPVAGAGRTRRYWPEIARALTQMGFRVKACFTEGPGWATNHVRSLLQSGCRHVVAVGGDGTVNEVANGFFADRAPIAESAVLSVIPLGTGRDFARGIGIRGIGDALRALELSQVRALDVACARFRSNGAQAVRFFFNAADVGLGAATAATVNRSRKIFGGLWTYVAGTVRALWTFRSAATQVEVDSRIISAEHTEMVLIANGRFHAGGMRMAPMADPADGWLEVLVLRKLSRVRLLFCLLPQVLRARHLSHPALVHARGKRVAIRSAEPLLFEMDGEQPGTTDVVVDLVPAALRVTVGGNGSV